MHDNHDCGCHDDLPFWGWSHYTPTIPKLYWNVKSQEQRILNLFQLLDKLIAYTDYVAKKVEEEIQGYASKEEMAEFKAQVEEELKALSKIINNLAQGTLQWDVQHGMFNNTVDAQRDMFNDVTIHSIPISTINEMDMTVEQLANCGLNVKGLALVSHWLQEKSDYVPADCKA